MQTRSRFKIYSSSQAAWDAMYTAMRKAERSIYWEMYICADDDAGKRFFDLFEAKARAGLDVKVIVDGWGSFWLSRERLGHLREAGVDMRIFHERMRRYRGIWHKIITRTHRKILIVDETVGFIGGVNVQKHMRDWLDLHVRIEGAAVASLLRAFGKMYLICGGKRGAIRHLLGQTLPSPGESKKEVDFIYDNGNGRSSRLRREYLSALAQAKRRIIFLTPYHFPDKEFMRALWQARRRGIRVDLLIPFRTDVRITTYAAYAWFAALSKVGARVHLLNRMMHGKAMLVDDEWAIVGSSNMEPTSYYRNYEANVRIRDRRIMRKLRGVARSWMQMAKLLDLTEWEKRGVWQRFKEITASFLYRVWHAR